MPHGGVVVLSLTGWDKDETEEAIAPISKATNVKGPEIGDWFLLIARTTIRVTALAVEKRTVPQFCSQSMRRRASTSIDNPLCAPNERLTPMPSGTAGYLGLMRINGNPRVSLIRRIEGRSTPAPISMTTGAKALSHQISKYFLWISNRVVIHCRSSNIRIFGRATSPQRAHVGSSTPDHWQRSSSVSGSTSSADQTKSRQGREHCRRWIEP